MSTLRIERLLTRLLRERYNCSAMTNIAALLHNILRQRAVPLRRLAMESGVSPSTLSRWLHGQQTPSPKSCQRLAEYLSLPIEQVLALAGHLRLVHKMNDSALPEFREYARQKYPGELDEDVIVMIEDLIYRRRTRREEDSRTKEGSTHTN